MQSPNWNRNQGNSSWGGQGSGMDRPTNSPSAGPWNPMQGFAGPGGVNPALKQIPQRQSGNTGGMTPSNPYMPRQDYFRGIAPWGGGQLQMQNPMMSMGQQGQGRMVGQASNPYMPQMQQPQQIGRAHV